MRRLLIAAVVALGVLPATASAGLELGLEALQGGPRLRLEIAGVRGVAVRPIGDLPGDIEDGLRAGHLDRLGIGRRIVDALCGIGLDRGHDFYLQAGAGRAPESVMERTAE